MLPGSDGASPSTEQLGHAGTSAAALVVDHSVGIHYNLEFASGANRRICAESEEDIMAKQCEICGKKPVVGETSAASGCGIKFNPKRDE